MPHRTATIGVYLWCLACATSLYALGQRRYLEFSPTPGAVRPVYNGLAAPVLIDPGDYHGVPRAAYDLQADINRATKIQPEHFERAVAPVGMHWQKIPDFGRKLSGVTPLPVTAQSQNPSVSGMRLEHKMYLFRGGTISVDSYLAPTLMFLPSPELGYAISFDDELPQVIDVHANDSQAVWERSVKDSIHILTSKHVSAQPGYHVLKFWVIDPRLVVEKFVVNTAGVRPSYLGPPESFYPQSLRDHANKIGMLIGAAVNPALFAEPAYTSTLVREFNMIEAENVMKWRTIRRNRDTFSFGPGDQVVSFAREHNMKVRGHTLLGSKYNPAWLKGGRFTPRQLRSIVREHITTVMKHYAGQVFAWDVVNEAFDASGKVERSIWYDSPGIGLFGKGTAYIEQAFRWARAADPKALLFYNDYDTEGLNAKSDAVYEMVKDFRNRGVPIDGVGLQMHMFNLSTKHISSIGANIARLTALGLEVHITEMDVALPLNKEGQLVDQADLNLQADIYRHVATACLRQPRCTALQTWGFTDKYTWVPGFTKGARGAPLLFDRDYAPKPAYKVLLDVFSKGVPNRTSL